MKLRYYQKDADEAAIDWMKKSTEPALIEAFQGAGKSLIIASIAKKVREMSGKYVLCLVPSATLLKQNAEKFKALGEHVSMFSASLKSKSLRYPCVLATPMSVKNSLDKFKVQFAAVILDEADRSLTPTILYIIDKLREKNPNLRVLGLTGTPFTMSGGYIYRLTVDGKAWPDTKAKDPYFAKQVYKIGRRELTEEGFIVPIEFGEISAERYDTESLALNSMNKFDSKEVDRVFVGQGRKTASIVADAVNRALPGGRVIFFSATIQHAKEVFASLPAWNSAIVTGDNEKEVKEEIKKYKTGEKRYIVCVNMLTVGFDDPGTHTIVVMRKTESSALYLQIIGRTVRPIYADGYDLETKEGRLASIAASPKKYGLILDYTDNPDFHFVDHDIDSPKISAKKASGGGEGLSVMCPDCGTENEFTARPNPDGFKMDSSGYFLDLMGERIDTPYGPMPSHMGRRCFGMQLVMGKLERCLYRWSPKKCPHCFADNDIAARYCSECKGEIVDPNNSLIDIYKPAVKDPYQQQTDRVIAWHTKKAKSKKDEDMLVVNYITENKKLVIFYLVRRPEYAELVKATNGGETKPETLTYIKDVKTGYYRALAYNQPSTLESA